MSNSTLLLGSSCMLPTKGEKTGKMSSQTTSAVLAGSLILKIGTRL